MQESILGDQPWLRNGRHAEGMVTVRIDPRADYYVSSVCTRSKFNMMEVSSWRRKNPSLRRGIGQLGKTTVG
jgi:hypothetical protein